MTAPILIAMATFNGARFLRPQLDSIAAQTLPGWRLLISDDGSTDGTRGVIEAFARTREPGQVTLIDGPRRGATRNFLHLTAQVPAGHWLAYADQDDVWYPQRLQRGAEFLARQQGPAIFAARTTICDHDLRPLTPAPHFPGPFGFRNALIQACLPGNTILANAEAVALMQRAVPAAAAAGIVSHDWWAYQVLSGAGARLHRDAAQLVYYRQHDDNVMGRNDTARARAHRAARLLDGQFAQWLARNQRALEPVADLLLPENRRLLADFGRLLNSPGLSAAVRMLKMGLYRQSRPGTAAVLAAAGLGRLRTRHDDSRRDNPPG
ncbi:MULTISPECIES: glycosyltransferase [unclassified Paracoccus (in: a-proteobacteria)]|uniref:glycosyltransferase n=1 Tax=unclassified Paracoccus (in: a-proteobacteria) TaxID=2688777 RepID=UPI0012B38189|nr:MULTISPECIES: glycosyltransferase [unclassified Paracoccus (in: a-proteobacteria)]UXU75114.1 glycosyltransferase [Paracoccus sp. SMMA_5]UXU81017.1 glycosyltransferase [Paracoccus sp. SMMA_5_TC]